MWQLVDGLDDDQLMRLLTTAGLTWGAWGILLEAKDFSHIHFYSILDK